LIVLSAASEAPEKRQIGPHIFRQRSGGIGVVGWAGRRVLGYGQEQETSEKLERGPVRAGRKKV